MKAKSADEQYSAEEIALRVKAAVQGAFKTEPKPLKSMTPKRPKTQRKVGVSQRASRQR
jgi:hypothetical protein